MQRMQPTSVRGKMVLKNYKSTTSNVDYFEKKIALSANTQNKKLPECATFCWFCDAGSLMVNFKPPEVID